MHASGGLQSMSAIKSAPLFLALGCCLLAGRAYSYDRASCMNGPADARIASCSRAIEETASDPQEQAAALFLRGNAYMDNHDTARAIADFDRSIKLSPPAFILAQAYFQRGTAYITRGEQDRAVADLSEAIKLKPDEALPYLFRGSLYSDLRAYDRASEDFTQVIKLNPDARTLATAYYRRGMIWGFKREQKRAIADTTESLRHNDKNPSTYLLRGLMLQQTGDHQAALRDFDAAIRLDPRDVKLYVSRAESYEALGRKAQAIADYRQALKIDDRQGESREALRRLGATP